jgi:hypothetical protein
MCAQHGRSNLAAKVRYTLDNRKRRTYDLKPNGKGVLVMPYVKI